MASSALIAFSSSSCLKGWASSSSPMLSKPSTTRRTMVSIPSISCSTLVDNSGLLRAAKRTVDTYIKNGMVIGLGSGHASLLAIQYLGQQLQVGALKDIVGIPTSVSSATEAAKAGIPLVSYQDNSQTILKAARDLVLVVTEKQYKGCLEGSIPVLVKSVGWMEIAEEIDDLFLGDAEVWRRPSIGHAGPLGGDFPLVTREGHNVLDVIFTSPIPNLAGVAESLDKINGVVEHGVISRMPGEMLELSSILSESKKDLASNRTQIWRTKIQ